MGFLLAWEQTSLQRDDFLLFCPPVHGLWHHICWAKIQPQQTRRKQPNFKWPVVKKNVPVNLLLMYLGAPELVLNHWVSGSGEVYRPCPNGHLCWHRLGMHWHHSWRCRSCLHRYHWALRRGAVYSLGGREDSAPRGWNWRALGHAAGCSHGNATRRAAQCTAVSARCQQRRYPRSSPHQVRWLTRRYKKMTKGERVSHWWLYCGVGEGEKKIQQAQTWCTPSKETWNHEIRLEQRMNAYRIKGTNQKMW